MILDQDVHIKYINHKDLKFSLRLQNIKILMRILIYLQYYLYLQDQLYKIIK